MATFSGAQARYQLSITGDPAGINVAGTNRVGVDLQTVNYTSANTGYSLRIVANAASDVATLYFENSTCLGTTGSPVITDGDGNDMEGVAIGGLATGNGLLIQAGTITGGGVAVDTTGSGASKLETYLATSDYHLAGGPSRTPPTTMTFTFPATATSGNTITVTVVGVKS